MKRGYIIALARRHASCPGDGLASGPLLGRSSLVVTQGVE